MTEITVEVLNGVVMDVYSTDPETYVTVLDYDIGGKKISGAANVNRMKYIETKHRVGIQGMDIVPAVRKRIEGLPV
jgi:hypothetical protein